MFFLTVMAGMLCIAFFLSSHLFYLRVPPVRYVPSVLLGMAVLTQVAAAGVAHPDEAVVHTLLAMMLGMVFMLTVLFTALLPVFDRRKRDEEE